MFGKTSGRFVAVALLLVSTATLTTGFVTSSVSTTGIEEGTTVAPPREQVTVITTDSNSWLGRSRGGPRARAELIAVGRNGTVIYYDDSHTRYWDVDPVPGTEATVEYVAADHLTPEECGGESVCTRNVVERVNLTTGAVTHMFGRVTGGKHSTRWHDVDRIDDERLLVADIAQDRVFVVNTTSNLVTWSWSAQNAYSVAESGGPFPDDWTHLNDVEYLGDGRIMVSLRNHDRVIFLDQQRGLVEEWTLGRENAHGILFEQHNPDYIPAEQGGPAVVVADSENNRLVEYRFANGTWARTWTWRDARLQWPRDADRLPNGHTLVTDSNGDRVFELDEDGTVVWSVDVAFPYEAERLGTGEESAGGPSARAGGLAGTASSDPVGADRTGASTPSRDPLASAGRAIDGLLRGPVVNGIVYVLPVWVGTIELVALAVLSGTLVGWAIVEWHWASYRLEVRSPLRLRRNE